MVIYTKVEISGVEINCNNCKITKTLGDNNSASNFTIDVNNYAGRYIGSFNIGNEVKVYTGTNGSVTPLMFLGILENIDNKGAGESESLTYSGRDYSARMIDRTVEPEVYNNLPAGSIVKDIIAKYTDDITTSNVVDGVNVTRIVFNHTPVFDAVKQLAEFTDYTFYVDESKDLHFVPKSTTSSGYIFNSGNIIDTSFAEQRDSVFNEVWVYGDRYLDGYKETLAGSAGTSGTTGSIYTLLYKPHNTQVTVDSKIIQPGGVFGMTYSAGSSKYLVNYNDKQIVFVSGTVAGDNNPGPGSAVIVDYMRDLPIVKMGEDDASVAQYGKRVKIVVDKNIKDPKTAEDIMKKELEKYSDPTKEGNLTIRNVANITPGQTCVVDIPIYNINNTTYDILEAKYKLTKENCLKDQVLSIKVNKKIPDITDTLKDLILKQRQSEGQDMADTDILTRYKTSTGSLGLRASGCKVYTKSIAGDSLIWGNATFGIWNNKSWGNVQLQSFILGNATAAMLGTSKLGVNAFGLNLIYNDATYGKYDVASYGDAGNYQQWVCVWSGCYF